MGKYFALLVLGIIALVASCSSGGNPNAKFKTGEIVYVHEEKCLVEEQPWEGQEPVYELKKLNCQSEDCTLKVHETEITKEPKKDYDKRETSSSSYN